MAVYPNSSNGPHKISSQEYFQKDIEIHGQQLLSPERKLDEVNIVIVGAWRGEEIASFLQWKNANIFAFEPNIENFTYLSDVYKNNLRVHCFNVACSNIDGFAELFQANLTGNDSLLPIQEREDFKTVSVQKVKTIRLDSLEEFRSKQIDLLWVDVQGFEKYVLLGAADLLSRTHMLFLELNDNDNAYKGATRISELVDLLGKHGFYMIHQEVSVQIDTGVKSGMGLFLKKSFSTHFFDQDQIDIRIKKLNEVIHNNLTMRQTWWFKLAVHILPVKIKKYIKSILAR